MIRLFFRSKLVLVEPKLMVSINIHGYPYMTHFELDRVFSDQVSNLVKPPSLHVRIPITLFVQVSQVPMPLV